MMTAADVLFILLVIAGVIVTISLIIWTIEWWKDR